MTGGHGPAVTEAAGGACRLCGAPLRTTFVDLGLSPLCESYVAPSALGDPEVFYPLHAYVCDTCFLVQLQQFVAPDEIFGDYAYFSSYSEMWLEHARVYVEAMIERFALGSHSRVVELASNDGYLLQYFVRHGVPVLGVEPAKNVAEVALRNGVPTRTEFFGRELGTVLAAEGVVADLVVANNVLAQVPDLHDFLAGVPLILAPGGVFTLEFPHLVNLVAENQFDTIYHEHFSYFSFSTAARALSDHDLTVFDVEELPTHGGSLRLFARHAADESRAVSPAVEHMRARETALGLDDLSYYSSFAARVKEIRFALLEFLIDARRRGLRVLGYGAPGKGNTLLNFCGVRSDLLGFTVDRSPHKQGKFLPGTRIPVRAPADLLDARPDYVLILPWNLKEEVVRQLAPVREWGGRFVVAVPEVAVLD